MDIETRKLLTRWQSLDKPDGLRRAEKMAVILRFVGHAIFLLVLMGVIYGFHPIAIAVAAFVSGWVDAEARALRTRIGQWPSCRRYIDWKRVEEDLNSEDMGLERTV